MSKTEVLYVVAVFTCSLLVYGTGFIAGVLRQYRAKQKLDRLYKENLASLEEK